MDVVINVSSVLSFISVICVHSVNSVISVISVISVKNFIIVKSVRTRQGTPIGNIPGLGQ